MTVQIDTAESLDDIVAALEVFRSVWGRGAAVDTDVYVAAARHGAYLARAVVDGQPVGASFAWLSEGGRALHSHMTGVVAGRLGAGVGFAIKQHQRAWAAERGIEAITWTYDPLVRRNAWFNLVRLGATVSTYHVDYYGCLDDAINGTDETDRLEVRWLVQGPGTGRPVEAGPDDERIEVPEDFESLRRDDPAAARRWRNELRQRLHGAEVRGMDADRHYVVRRRSK